MYLILKSNAGPGRGLRARRHWGLATFLAATALAGMALTSTPAAAELVILRGGEFLKAKSHHLEAAATEMSIDLRSGGRLTLPIGRIERIVADEVPDDSPTPSGPFPIHFAPQQRVPTTPYGSLIYKLAREQALNPRLVAAVVRAESGFDPQALSDKGARGLLQLMPATAERFGVSGRQLYDPRLNLEAGIRYLSWLAHRFGDDLPRVLAAYNAGEATVKRYRGIPPFRETRDYIRRIYASLGLAAEPSLAGR